MDWTYALIIAIAGLVGLIFGQAVVKKTSSRKSLTWFSILFLAVGLLAYTNAIPQLSALNQVIGGAVVPASIGTTGGISSVATTYQGYQPTATYATQDAFVATTSIPGTSYYKRDGDRLTSTAITNTQKGVSYTYWVSNGTYYVEPTSFTASGTDNVVNSKAYQNGSITISGYDVVNDKAVSSSAYNTSMGANANAKLKFTVVGSAKTSALPLGGVMVVELNSTIPTVSCSGDGIVGVNNKHQVTYTATSLANRYVIYEVAKGFDLSKDGGSTGVTNVIRCDFTNGATAVGAGSAYYIKFIPANYYVGNDGNLYLDVEQKMNGATTRTGYGSFTSTFYWGA